jgi:uncharacterized membrane protein YdfJ with MMPL/SSD domain
MGVTANRRQARAALPADRHKNLSRSFRAEAAAVVFTVRVVVCAVAPLMVAEAGMLQVAGSLAATGVMAQLRLIAPVNP